MSQDKLKQKLYKQVESFHHSCLKMGEISYKDYIFGALLFGLYSDIINDQEMDYLLEKFHDTLTRERIEEIRSRKK